MNNSLLLGLLLVGLWQGSGDPRPPLELAPRDDTHDETPAPVADYVVYGTQGQPLLYLPRDEKLVYRVHVGVAFLDASVGTVTQTSKVAPYRPSILGPAAQSTPGAEGQSEQPGLSADLELRAEGSYALYSLDSTIEAHHHPQAWPRIVYRLTQKGSSKRRRENKIGVYDGEFQADYRRDSSTGAPKGTRIWKESTFRKVPPDTLDMLSAVFACRTLIREGADEMTFPMVEKDRLWEFTIRRGEEQELETGAGTFAAVEILLEPKPWPDEEISEEKVARFEGLFGMQGTIHLWAHSTTGVPLRIRGDLPAGPLSLGIDVVLESYEGTPEAFQPVGAGESPTTQAVVQDGRSGGE